MAPEREVIDRYDINGYFSKLETTEDKLYSLVKAGVRQHAFMSEALLLFEMLAGTIAGARSADDVRQVMGSMAQRLGRNLRGEELTQFDLRLAIVIGDEPLMVVGMDPQAAVSECRRLDGLGGTPVGADGDKYVQEGRDVLFKSAASASGDTAYMLYKDVEAPGQGHILLDVWFLKAVAALIKRFEAREPVAAGA